jgi:hypothetical protein
LQDRTAEKKFDFIKLDIEGAEKEVLADESSCRVLCKAICILMETHDRFVPGSKAAFDTFIASGCEGESLFEHVLTTGEYIGVCRKDVVRNGPPDS